MKLEKELNALAKALYKAHREERDFYRKHIAKKKKPDPDMVKKDKALMKKARDLEKRVSKKIHAIAAYKIKMNKK